MEKIAPSNESFECYIFTLLVKITQLSQWWLICSKGLKKKDRLYLTLVTLGPELCPLVLVWLITEEFVMYSMELHLIVYALLKIMTTRA